MKKKSYKMINEITPNPNATEKGPDKETIRQGITQQVNWFIFGVIMFLIVVILILGFKNV